MPPRLGANYRVKKVAVGATSELQLSYEQTLVLTVNRDTGNISIRNPLAGHIAIDSYSSHFRPRLDVGQLCRPWRRDAQRRRLGQSRTAPGGNTVNALTEVKQPDLRSPSEIRRVRFVSGAVRLAGHRL